MNNKKLTVVDLFCGGGGLSAGFEQAGFKLILGLDYDNSAVETFRANHRNSKAQKVDLRHYDVRKLPKADILIGGPPCTQFSTSKSNKTRNVLDGLELVQTFLRAVYIKKPKYWVMENVAAIQKYLPTEIPLSWIGLDKDGTLEIPNRVELVAADFGVPQKRVRYLIGNFPTPPSTHIAERKNDLFTDKSLSEWRTLGELLSNFPSPLRNPPKKITDPNYEITIDSKLLTDHFYDTRLTKEEVRALRKAKEQHPFMGFMPFAESLDKPARTVVATQLGRETLVLEDSPSVYRRLTVRECALIQTFPISFQFMGSSYATKYKLVGNAVPPRLAFHIAQQIRLAEGLFEKSKPNVEKQIHVLAEKPSKPFNNGKRKGKFFEFRRFSESVPGKEQRGCRCEFNNLNYAKQDQKLDNFEGQIWTASIYVGEGRNCHSHSVDLHEIEEILNNSDLKNRLKKQVVSLKKQIIHWLDTQVIPNGKELQRIWGTGTHSSKVFDLVDGVSAIVDQNFPQPQYSDLKIQTQACSWFPSQGIRIRILLGALGATILAEKLNQPASA